MKEVSFGHKDQTWTFRKLVESDTDWLNSRFAEPGKPVGIINFKDRISNFEQVDVLQATLMIVMHHLSISHKNLSLQEFADAFGVTYQDTSLLYKNGLSFCVGVTNKQLKKASKVAHQNTKLKKENRALRYENSKLKLKNAMKTAREIIWMNNA